MNNGGNMGGYNQPNRNIPNSTRGPGGNMYVTEMRKKIDDYFQIVLRNVKDSIPRTIGYFLVRKS